MKPLPMWVQILLIPVFLPYIIILMISLALTPSGDLYE